MQLRLRHHALAAKEPGFAPEEQAKERLSSELFQQFKACLRTKHAQLVLVGRELGHCLKFINTKRVPQTWWGCAGPMLG